MATKLTNAKKPSLGQRLHEAEISRDTYHQLYDQEHQKNQLLIAQVDSTDAQLVELRQKVLDREAQSQRYLRDREEAKEEARAYKRELVEVRAKLEHQLMRNTDLNGDLQRCLGYIDRILEGETVEVAAVGDAMRVSNKRGPVLTFDRNAMRHDNYL